MKDLLNFIYDIFSILVTYVFIFIFIFIVILSVYALLVSIPILFTNQQREKSNSNKDQKESINDPTSDAGLESSFPDTNTDEHSSNGDFYGPII